MSEEELGPGGVVDLHVQVLGVVALGDPSVPAPLVRHACAPDLGRLHRDRQLVRVELLGRLRRAVDDPCGCPVAEREHQ
jgi:hypothetical protein